MLAEILMDTSSNQEFVNYSKYIQAPLVGSHFSSSGISIYASSKMILESRPPLLLIQLSPQISLLLLQFPISPILLYQEKEDLLELPSHIMH